MGRLIEANLPPDSASHVQTFGGVYSGVSVIAASLGLCVPLQLASFGCEGPEGLVGRAAQDYVLGQGLLIA